MQEHGFKIPSTAVCLICANNWNDLCQECLDNGLDAFTPKEGLTLADMPRFPTKEFNNGLSVATRQALLSFYLEKIVDLLR
jgi:hypothetical protein